MNKIAIMQYGSVSPLSPSKPWEDYLIPKSAITYESTTPQAVLHSLSEQRLTELKNENERYKPLDRSVLMAIISARKAMKNFTKKGLLGINIGSSRGATALFEKHYQYFLKNNKALPLASPTTTLGNVSSWVGQDLQQKNISFSHSITCSTALHGILNAIAWLESGLCTQFLAGGTEAPLTPFTFAQMKALRMYSSLKNAFPCQSLNLKKTENTQVLGEGAAVFLLEKENVSALAHIIGIGFSTENIQHSVSISKDAECFQSSMKMALKSAQLPTVDVIVTHAPGTKKGDLAEYKAIQKIFTPLPYLTSNKWKIGHTFGTSGALSLEMALLMLQNQQVVPNPCISFEQKEPSSLKTIMINSTGFGGNAVSLLICR